MFRKPRAIFDASNWDWSPTVILADFNYRDSRIRAKSELNAPTVTLPAIVFRPIKTKLAPSHRLSRRVRFGSILIGRRQLILNTRWQLPVTDIDPMILVNPPAYYTVENNPGFFFDNSYGKVFLEVISSTIAQNFTVITGHVIANEWSISDDIFNVSNADTRYFIGPFPRDRYNQPNSNYVFVDHATNAILNFRAWRIP